MVFGASDPTPPLSLGMVRDYLGRALPGVEIVVFPLGHSGVPSGSLHTDELGHFSLDELGPGSYLLALIKPGYRIRLAEANSRLLSLLQLRLDPEGEAKSVGSSDETMGWVLRLPPTDILKEVGESVPVASDSPREPSGGRGEVAFQSRPAGVGRPPLSGEVSQWYTSTLPGTGGDPESPGSTGRGTTVQVRGSLPGRGDWEVGGLTQSLNTDDSDPQAPDPARDQGANRLRLGMRYQVSSDDSVQIRARFDSDSFHTEGDAEGLGASSQAVRTVGYQANWSRSLGKEEGFDVELGYLQSEARLPVDPSAPAVDPSTGDLRDWRWNAQAGYHLQLSSDHRLTLAAKTRIFSYDQHDAGWILTPVQPDLSLIEAGEHGWGVSLSGEDSWSLTQPFSLILGLDTHLAEGEERTLILVPRVGARKEGERSMIQGWILFRADSLGGAQEDTGGAGKGTDTGSLGYRAEVSRAFNRNWVLGGHLERNPLGSSAVQEPLAALQPATPEVMLISDTTDTWSEEAGIAVSKKMRGVEGSLESSQGRVVGRLAGGLSEAPVLVLEEGGARYLALRASANVEKTDTQVHLNFTRLDGETLSPESGGALSASRMEIMVFQPIPFISNRGAGEWKVLLGFQSVTRDPGDGSTPEDTAWPERIHRFSGGVGVSF